MLFYIIFLLLKDGFMNKNINYSLINNTANQISYKNYSNSSNNFSEFFSYSPEIYSRLFPLIYPKKLNKKTLEAIEESKILENMVIFSDIDELFKDLEN